MLLAPLHLVPSLAFHSSKVRSPTAGLGLTHLPSQVPSIVPGPLDAFLLGKQALRLLVELSRIEREHT